MFQRKEFRRVIHNNKWWFVVEDVVLARSTRPRVIQRLDRETDALHPAVAGRTDRRMEKRGAKEQKEYAILTAEISKAAFGLTPTEYAEFKKRKHENLRDHMTDLSAMRHAMCRRRHKPKVSAMS
jgi:hypothetical protein